MKPNEFFKKRFGIMDESNNAEKLMSNLISCIAEDCGGCSYKTDACKTGLLIDVERLIVRQKAEIEKLRKIQQVQADRIIDERGEKYEQIEVISKLKKHLATAKSEAVREFAEELMYNLDGDIGAYANAGHGLNVYSWLESYLASKGAIETEAENGKQI